MTALPYVSIMLHKFGLSLTSRKKIRAVRKLLSLLKRFGKLRL
jgi:hypothetical protein